VSNEFLLLFAVLGYLTLSAWTLGFYRALTLQRSAVFMCVTGMATVLTYMLCKAFPQWAVLGQLSQAMGVANYAFLIVFIRSLRLSLTRQQELWASAAVVLVTLMHLAINSWVSGRALYLIMSVQVLILMGWLIRDSWLLHRVRPSRAGVFLLFILCTQGLMECVVRLGVVFQNHNGPLDGSNVLVEGQPIEWFGVSMFMGFLAQWGVAGVLLKALTQANTQLIESKQLLLSMYQDLEVILKQKDAQLTNLMASREARAAQTELASLAHELKQPIMAIQLNTEYLMNDKLLDADQETEILNAILQDNRRTAAIIQALRNTFATPLPLELLPVLDLSHFVQDSTRRMGRIFNQKGVQLELNIIPGLRVHCDETQLGMVIDNLIKNAVQAMEKSSVKLLTVSLYRMDQRAVLDVIDSGAGVPAEIKEKIFDMNFTTKPDGTGIGLWLSRRIAHECAGHLLLVPREAGTQFSLTLPCLN
jgi:signal transduction histidine kinase